MNALAYITQSFAWSVAGGLVGYMVGNTIRRTTEGADVTEQPRRWRPKFEHIISVIVVTLGVATAVQGVVLGQRTDDLSRCQLAYSTGFADALDARSQANQDAQDALDDLMRTVGEVIQSTDPTRGVRMRDAVTEYLSKRAAARQTQQDNPYPPAPRVCGDSMR